MRPKKPSRIKNRNLEGRYANYFEIGHNAFEFIIDFGQYYPENDQAELCARIVTTPAYAEAFLTTLQQSVLQYRKQYGAVPQNKTPRSENSKKNA